MKVYFVDDNEEFINVTTELLRKYDYQVEGFCDPEKFLDEINMSPQDLLFLDIKMPRYDGISMLKKITTLSVTPKIVLMSGYDGTVLHSAAAFGRDLKLNVIAVLAKPFNYKSIIQILAAQIHLDSNSIKLQSLAVSSKDIEITKEDVMTAFNEQQFQVYYQPQIEILSKKIIGFESLIRWQHPEYGLLVPDYFIEAMKSADKLFELFSWMLKEVENSILDMSLAAGKVKIAINVVCSTLVNPDFIMVLQSFLKESKLDANLLTIELIESEFIYSSSTVLDVLLKVRLLGVRLSIDDFGTGYSSLTLLHKMPFTELKIDKSFVLRVCEDVDSRKIVRSCIALADQLNLDVVAEGVESQEVLDYLTLESCLSVQGYFIAKPMDVEQAIQWSTDYTSQLLS